MIDMVFWPILDLMLWGILTTFLERQQARLPVPIAFLLGGVLLWDLVFRSKNGIAIAVLSEGYTQNLVNVLASPVTPTEYLAGLLLFAISRTAVSWIIMTGLAWLLFSFGVVGIGPALVAYVGLLLLYGVALAMIVVGLVFRFGPAADELAWAIGGLVVPFAAVYYPLMALPGWARAVASAMPPARIFESMRAVLAGRAADPHALVVALALDLVYLAAGLAYANAMFAVFRRRGFVTRYM
jgi:ABC-2 type transport system permease protein